MMKHISLLVAALALAGCATVTQGTSQKVNVASEPEQGAECALSNGTGKWSVTTPGTVEVHKSVSPLDVKCSKAGYADGAVSVKSTLDDGASMGNAFLGGAIGAAIDASSGAAHKYPAAITVKMERSP